MRIVYLASSGLADPVRASLPLHIAANGSLEVGHEVSLILAGDATELVLGDRARSVEALGLPPLRDLIDKLVKHEVPVFV